MEKTTTDRFTLYFDREEQDAAEIIEEACQRSIRTITETWGLKPPQDFRVYVMNSWPRCVFLGAPMVYQIILALTTPLWYSRFKLLWTFAGGWAQQYGKRQVVGIKAPRLIEQTPATMGNEIFIEIDDNAEKVTSITCHELTHAFTSHLSLPVWLNEGLAMVTVDCCLNKTTVKPETLDILRASTDKDQHSEKIDLASQDKVQISRIYIRGYWLTRFLYETQPELLKSFLEMRLSSQEIDIKIADVYGVTQNLFWEEIGREVLIYFVGKTSDNSV